MPVQLHPRASAAQAVGIGRLERFVVEQHYRLRSAGRRHATPTGKRVAVVGSGPSGAVGGPAPG